MELRQLKCFLACARCHSLTLAAEELYTSQPHVSMIVKSLEQELGTQLFYRKSKGVELTGFIGQNYGARRLDRVREGIKKSIIDLTAFTVVAGMILIFCSQSVLSLFTADVQIAANGQQAILCVFPFYFLYSINQIYMGGLKGLGDTGYPMFCCMICYCIFRVAWCSLLIPIFHDIRVIYFSYDVSWIIMIVLLIRRYRRTLKKIC